MGILRFLLAISVVLNHSSSIFGCSLVGGQVAVQAFYIISGFYMSLILNEKYIGINNSYKLFITNRLLRLYPLYWTVLILTILSSFAIILYSNGTKYGNFEYYILYYDKMGIMSFLFLIFTNIFLFFQDIVMFLGLNTTTGNLFFTSNFRETSPMLFQFLFVPQAWTIGVEIAFYLIAPFIVRQKHIYIFSLILLSISTRVLLSFYGFNVDPWSYRFFPTELVFFLMGIIAYHIYKKYKTININKIYLVTILIIIISFTITYSFINIDWISYIYLFIFFIALPFIFILTKNWKRDNYIGELSYPIYISHIFMLTFLSALKLTKIGNLGLILSISSITFSLLANQFITKKIEKVRQNRIKQL